MAIWSSSFVGISDIDCFFFFSAFFCEAQAEV